MLVFDSLETGPLQTNCYILGDSESRQAVVVDPGGHVGAIRSALDRHDLACRTIINTHSHFDHVGGNAGLKQSTGAELLIHAEEAEMLQHLSQQGALFGIQLEDSPAPDRTIGEGEVISIGEIRIRVLHTPGHSPGSISLAVEGQKMILVGDLIFAGSVGRTDLPGGSTELLLESAKEKILKYPDDTRLFPGHGPATTVGRERKTNPFLTGELW